MCLIIISLLGNLDLIQSIFCIYSVKKAWSLAELNESVLILTAFLSFKYQKEQDGFGTVPW